MKIKIMIDNEFTKIESIFPIPEWIDQEIALDVFEKHFAWLINTTCQWVSMLANNIKTFMKRAWIENDEVFDFIRNQEDKCLDYSINSILLIAWWLLEWETALSKKAQKEVTLELIK